MAYRTVLLDLDHTLLDSDASEVAAFEHTLAAAGIEPSASLLADYRSINQRLWAEVEAGSMAPDVVRTARFAELCDRHRIEEDPEVMSHDFAEGLKSFGDLNRGARKALDHLAAIARLGLITNGISDIQRSRIRRLNIEEYFDVVVISAEVGVSKPDPEIFSVAFEALGHPALEQSLMVGDSLTSDMYGAAAFGIDGCWYNPSFRARPASPPIAHEIRSLDELPSLLA